MSDLLDLPLELLSSTVRSLAEDSYPEKDLSALSLSSSIFLPLCREHLFKYVNIDATFRLLNLADVIDANPDILQYIKSVRFNPPRKSEYDDRYVHRMMSLFETFTQVQCVNILGGTVGPYYIYRDPLSLEPATRLAIVTLISLPQLTKLVVDSWRSPYQLFASCGPQLQELLIGRTTLYEASSEELHEGGLPRETTLRTLKSLNLKFDIRNDGYDAKLLSKIFDLSSLKSLSVSIADTMNANFFLRSVETLETLHITGDSWYGGADPGPLLGLMKPSVFSTLTSFTFSCMKGNTDMFSVICNGLAPFTSLRWLHLEHHIYNLDESELHMGKHWDKLDAVISSNYSTAPAPLELTILIKILILRGTEFDPIKKAQLEGILENYLTHIRGSTNIKLVFEVSSFESVVFMVPSFY